MGHARGAARAPMGVRTAGQRAPLGRGRPGGAAMYAAGAGYGAHELGQGAPELVPAAPPPRARPDAVVAGVCPAQRRGPQGPQPRAPAEGLRDRLRREGRCLLCEQLGHVARECPENAPRRRE